MNINVDIIIKVIIPILGAIVTYVLVPYIRKKFSNEQLEYIYAWVVIAVRAAEQMNNAGLINIPKKEYVIQHLNEKGLDISESNLDAMIEAAVKELKIELGEV